MSAPAEWKKDHTAPRQRPYLTTREPRIGVTLTGRHQDAPDHVLQIAWRAQHRLHRVHRRLRAHRKPPNVVNVACARELACFMWAAAPPP